jgi:hypothetical protein
MRSLLLSIKRGIKWCAEHNTNEIFHAIWPLYIYDINGHQKKILKMLSATAIIIVIVMVLI